MPIVNSIISWVMKKRIHQINLFLQYPNEVQHEVFRQLISTAEDTTIGKKYGFRDQFNLDTFKSRVPVQTYEDLQPLFERTMAGEQNLFWPTEIKCFSKSSGTTSGKSKYIPVSQEALEDCHFKAGKDMLSLYFNNYEQTNLFSGKGLMLAGSKSISENSEGVISGDLSALLVHHLPIWAEYSTTPGEEIALMEDWEEKIERIVQITSKERVSSMSGVPSWLLVVCKRMLEYTGKSNLKEVWPDMELFMHGGVSFDPYRKRFKELIPSDDMRYLEIYNASEGFFAMQDQKEHGEMLLMLDYGIFYEFIPMAEWDKEFPETLTLDQVEIGQNYALVITTNAGLWRYKIGDTVMFTSTDPFRIKVTGRTKHFINAFGEELIIDNAETALKLSCEDTKASIVDYTAAPIYMEEDSGGHEWIIEFENQPDSLEHFTKVFDKHLKSLNSDYEAKRYHDKILKEPKIHLAESGLFYNWLKKKDKLGGQNKVPRLSNNRDFVEELLEMNQK